MNQIKLTTALLLAGLTVTGSVCAADAQAATPDTTPKPATRPTTLPPAATKQGVTFDKDIKPLFTASCVKCHGEQKPKGNLRLDTRDGVLAGGEEGKVVTLGDSAKSKLVISVARINPKSAMPPETRQGRGRPSGQGGPGGVQPNREGAATSGAKEGTTPPTGQGGQGGPGGRMQGPPPKPLTAEEVGLVRAWIDQGAN